MAKKETAAEALERRSAFIGGGLLVDDKAEDKAGSIGAASDRTAKDNNGSGDGQNDESSRAQSEGKPEVTAARTEKKKSSTKQKGGVVIEDPRLKRAVLKSKVQKTLRFSPMLIMEYEDVCEAMGVEPQFNNHLNDALTLWLDKHRK